MIIAISRQRGSGGAFVGRTLATRLGFRYIDREMLRHAAEFLHAQQEEECVEPVASGWFDRLVLSFAVAGAETYVPPSSDALYEGELFDVEQRLLFEIAAEQDAVVVGRGAAQTLKGRPGVRSIFLHAPEAWRVQRVKLVYQIAEQRAAEKSVRESDRDRARFVRDLGRGDWTDARVYDMSFDSAALGFEAVIDLVARSIGAQQKFRQKA